MDRLCEALSLHPALINNSRPAESQSTAYRRDEDTKVRVFGRELVDVTLGRRVRRSGKRRRDGQIIETRQVKHYNVALILDEDVIHHRLAT